MNEEIMVQESAEFGDDAVCCNGMGVDTIYNENSGDEYMMLALTRNQKTIAFIPLPLHLAEKSMDLLQKKVMAWVKDKTQ